MTQRNERLDELGELAGRFLRLAEGDSTNDLKRQARATVSLAASVAALVHMLELFLPGEAEPDCGVNHAEAGDCVPTVEPPTLEPGHFPPPVGEVNPGLPFDSSTWGVGG